MKLIMLSDTHGLHDQINVPDGDVLIHAGDFCYSGKLGDLQKFADWFKALPHKNKICIAGNHDWAAQHFMDEGKEDLLREIFYPAHYLRDSGLTLEGIKFWGSPWTPEFCNWAFNLERGEQLRAKCDLIPRDTDVLITHGPPAGIMDKVRPFIPHYLRTKGGCDDLYEACKSIRPAVHVFGHIHGGYGHQELVYPVYDLSLERRLKLGRSSGTISTQCFNASVANERYKVVNAPWVYGLKCGADYCPKCNEYLHDEMGHSCP